MARPLIGITGQLEAAHWGDWVREAVLSPLTYTRAVERAGGTPIILPPVPPDSVTRLVAGLDGLVLTGERTSTRPCTRPSRTSRPTSPTAAGTASSWPWCARRSRRACQSWPSAAACTCSTWPGAAR